MSLIDYDEDEAMRLRAQDREARRMAKWGCRECEGSADNHAPWCSHAPRREDEHQEVESHG